jgi:hypothetical protein
MDLFKPLVAEKHLHPNFRPLLKKRSAANRAVLEKWAEGFVDRDGKFVREFQTTFNSAFWELHIFACCKELGFNVNVGFNSPDFVIDNFHNEFCIEAVIASNAQDEIAEWERDINIRPDPENVLQTATIRLSNAIHGKYVKFQDSYKILPHVKRRPFVIALGPFEQPYFYIQNDHAIRQVLYSYDRVGHDGKHHLKRIVNKASGAPIELGLFTSTRMPEISAILFSNTATMSKLDALNSETDALMFFSALRFNAFGSKPFLQNAGKADYRESLLDGLYVFHNSYALYPLPSKYFDHPDIAQGILFPGETVPRYKCRHGSLIQRSCFRAIPKGSDV